MMLLYVITNEDVLLIQSGDMHNLLRKVYSFTHKFHAEITNTQLLDDGAFVFTQRKAEEELSRVVGGGGPHLRTRKVANK